MSMPEVRQVISLGADGIQVELTATNRQLVGITVHQFQDSHQDPIFQSWDHRNDGSLFRHGGDKHPLRDLAEGLTRFCDYVGLK